MTSRVLIGSAAAWLGLYLLAYVLVVHAQQGDVARWYVGLGLLALFTCVTAAAGLAPARTSSAALVLTVVVTLAGLLSIGLLLVPAVVALSVALLVRPAALTKR